MARPDEDENSSSKKRASVLDAAGAPQGCVHSEEAEGRRQTESRSDSPNSPGPFLAVTVTSCFSRYPPVTFIQILFLSSWFREEQTIQSIEARVVAIL